jgi:hypothetical protein
MVFPVGDLVVFLATDGDLRTAFALEDLRDFFWMDMVLTSCQTLLRVTFEIMHGGCQKPGSAVNTRGLAEGNGLAAAASGSELLPASITELSGKKLTGVG